MNGNFSQIPEQRAKTFLLEMPAVGENFVQPFLRPWRRGVKSARSDSS
jgi:hypothetical protein